MLKPLLTTLDSIDACPYSISFLSTEYAYFVLAMRLLPTDAEVPQISTSKMDISMDTTLVIVFGCRNCDTKFDLKVATDDSNSNLHITCTKLDRIIKRWTFSYITMTRADQDYQVCYIFPEHIEAEANGGHFADDTFKCIFLNENVRIFVEVQLNLFPNDRLNNTPALFQIMVCRLVGTQPLCEPMMVILLTHICVTRPQWAKQCIIG